MTAPRKLFYVDDTRFDLHVADGPHPERPERLEALRRGLLAPLRDAGAEALIARHATDQELTAAHQPALVEQVRLALDRGEAQLDGDTYLGAGTREAAWLAAGSAALLATRLCAEDDAAGVLLARPPGHHATRSQSMGFCLFNNVAIAAYKALASGRQRVAIVDWDVHHGNGTADIFADDPRVLFISLHQWPLYPGTGASHEVGRGAGRGTSINLPLPPGSSHGDYAAAFERVVLPALHQFAPECLFISAGFDAHQLDPLASMRLQDEDFGAMTSAVWSLAQHMKSARLGLFLEGGYSLEALESAGAEVARSLVTARDVTLAPSPSRAAERAIDETRRALAGHFEL